MKTAVSMALAVLIVMALGVDMWWRAALIGLGVGALVEWL